MPRIPAYQPQIQPQPLPDVRVNASAPAGAFGAGLGQGLQQAAGVLDQLVHQDDVARVQDAENQAQQAQLDIKGWFGGLKGRDALDPSAYGGGEEKARGARSLEEVTLRRFDDSARQIQDGLSTDTQKRMFAQSAARFRMDLQGQVQNHVQKQDRDFKVDTFNGVSLMEDANVAQNGLGPDGRLQAGTIAQSIARKVYAAGQLSDLLGEAPEMRQARVLAAQSETHSLVLDAMLKANQAGAAQTYFDLAKQRGELDPKVIGVMEGKIHANAMANTVQAQADRISGMGLTFELQDVEAQKTMAGNPDGLRLLRGELGHRFDIHKASQTAALQDAEGQIWGAVFPVKGQGVSVAASIKALPNAWAALGGNEAARVRANLEAYGRRDQNDPAAQAQRLVNLYDEVQKGVQDPGYFRGLSDGAILSMTPRVGVEGVKTILEARANALNPQPGKPVPVMSHDVLLPQVQAAWQQASLVGDKPSEAEKSKMSQFVEYIRRVQQGSGVQWDLNNTLKLINEKSRDIVTGKAYIGTDPHQQLWQVESLVPAWFRAVQQQTGRSGVEAAQDYFALKDQHAFDVPPAYAAQVADLAASKGLPPPHPGPAGPALVLQEAGRQDADPAQRTLPFYSFDDEVAHDPARS